ncbi:PAS domain-containing sensor histidine kinase [Fulvivirgaceae bacterium BMA10]|uniref:histidine kinase n=1 Tax=Splendidivirga corallicola TaxID=3051826 RepID=A0ABT8KQH0_9BACT|nr:PAS domain-containing sensor histidine kinase [Fulvivirgaceae bacterium BMA10]
MDGIETLIEFFQDVIVIIDEKSIIKHCNTQVKHVFGYEPEELSNKNLSILLTREMQEMHEKYVDIFFKHPRFRESVHGENIKGIKKDGSEIYLEIALAPYFKEGKVLGIAAIREPDDQRKVEVDYRNLFNVLNAKKETTANQIQKSQNLLSTLLLYQSVFRDAPDLMAIVDLEFRFSAFNNAFARAFKNTYDKGLEVGMSLIEALPDDHEMQSIFMKHWMAAADSPIDTILKWKLNDTDEKLFPSIFKSLEDNKNNRIGILILSYTRKRTFTEDLIENNFYFGKYIKMNEFLHKVNHDLHAPLNSILGLIQIVEYDKGLKEDTQACISKIKNSAAFLKSYLDDLIRECLEEFSDDQRVSFDQVISDVQDSLGRVVEENNIDISCSFKIQNVQISKSLIYSIFLNFISNAIKYQRKDVQSFLHIRTIDVNEYVVIVFEDNGIGIDLEKHGHLIFEPGKRISNDTVGKGIGLFLIKKQLEELDGKIEVESTPTQGTIFKVFIKNNGAL